MFESNAVPDARQVDVASVRKLVEALASASAATDAKRIELVEALERVKGAAAAAQARLTDAFAESQRTEQRLAAEDSARTKVEVEKRANRSIWSQIALARRESPRRGQMHVGLARALVREMPFTLDALARGEISEWRAILVARETAVLSVTDRKRVDFELADRLPGLGDKGVADEARRIADRIDPEAAARRVKRAESDRRVSIRPAPGSMANLTGLLPVAQGVAAYAALRKQALSLRTKGDQRSIGAIMADELVARILGTDGSATPDVEIGLIMTERTLFRGGQESAALADHNGRFFGHIPGVLARRLVRDAENAFVRRLYANPASGELVAMDSRRRTFSGALRQLIVWRDQTCRTPYCEAPIRHVDHVEPAAKQGETHADNAQGLCEACNYAKESTGWRADVVDLSRHRIQVTTAMGERFGTGPPPAPGHTPLSGEDRLRHFLDDWRDETGS